MKILASPDMTVLQLKESIKHATLSTHDVSIEVAQMQLIWLSEICLMDRYNMANYGIQHGSTLQLNMVFHRKRGREDARLDTASCKRMLL